MDHKTLSALLKKKIGDIGILRLLREIIESFSPGIPIGNLTSQLFANIYLNELDWFVKCRLSERHYVRYMDDFIVLSSDKPRLRFLREAIGDFLRTRLKLSLHPKKREIFPIGKGIDFLGYRIMRGYRLLRKSTVKRFVKRLKRAKDGDERAEAFRRWQGYASFAKSRNLCRDLRSDYCVPN